MATKKVDEVLNIPPIELVETTITIVGDSPLLIHAFSDKAKREILQKQMKIATEKTKRKEARNPVEDFINALHWMDAKPEEMTMEAFEQRRADGARIGFPAVGIKQCALSAAYREGLAKNKVVLQGAFFIPGELLEVVGDLRMREDYVKIPMGGADICYRGEFATGWRINIPVRYNRNGSYSLSQIVHFLNLGGLTVGIGDWRTEKGGNMGAFHVEGM